jgi:citrate lyase subunit beta/citryl-CoA lyase
MKALAKAAQRGADCLVLDLEDAVAPQAKAAARENIAGFLRGGGGSGKTEVIVRINAPGSAGAGADLEMVASVGADGVLAPKIEGAQDVHAAAGALKVAGVPETMPLWVMMETPLAMLNAAGIAACAGGRVCPLEVLVVGSNDLYAGLRARPTPDRAGIFGLLGGCVAAARAYGLDIIDGVYNDFADAAGFAAECHQGRVLGMDGKSLIHPAQIETCNRLFSPDEAEILWSRAVVEAFALPENAGKGAISLDGCMVERLHLEAAKRVLVLAGSGSLTAFENK